PAPSELAEAVRLAEGACQATEYREAAMLYTLAVTYAAAGRTPEAVETAQPALARAPATRQERLVRQVHAGLAGYEGVGTAIAARHRGPISAHECRGDRSVTLSLPHHAELGVVHHHIGHGGIVLQRRGQDVVLHGEAVTTHRDALPVRVEELGGERRWQGPA